MSVLLLLLLAAAPAPAAAEAPALAVLSASPSGPAPSGAFPEAVVVSFNQPMVELASPSDMGRDCPLKLKPSVPGRCRWRGTQVLAFEPETPLPPATAYRAVIPSGTRSAVSGRALDRDYEWSFETRRPQLEDSRPRDGERWVAPGATLFLHFDLPMDPRRARGDIVLEETSVESSVPEREIPVGVRRAAPEEVKAVWPWSWGEVVPTTATVLAVKPSIALRRGRAYRLVLKEGLKAAEGTLGLWSERSVRFEPPAAFAALSGPGRACLPRGYELALSNPVRLGDLLARLRVEGSTRTWPAGGRNLESTGERDEKNRRVLFSLPDPGLEPDRDYALIVSSGLTDAFGETLSSEIRLPFSNDGLCPRLNMPSGFGVLEQGLPARHPVTAVNMASAPVRKAVVADDAFIPFYEGIKWGCRDEMLPDAPVEEWNLSLPRNRSLRTFVEVGSVFSAAIPPRAGGLAALEVVGPEGCPRKAVLDVTRLGLHFKTSPDSTLLWATFLKTGLPARGVPVELRDDANKVLWRGRTDREGLADAPGWVALGIKDWKRWSRPNLWAFAKDPRGTAVLSLDWRGGLEPWRFDLISDWTPRPRRYRATLFTERGVYRSGETVRVKALARKLDGGDWRPLGPGDPRDLVMTLTDARGAEVAAATVTLSGESSLDHGFTLGGGAPSGRWTVSLREPGAKDPALVRPVAGEDGEGEDEGVAYAGGENRVFASRVFRVEAFKPAAFEVKVAASSPSWTAGDAYEAGVEGWWLFGAPMAGEKASWTLRLEPSSYEPPGWPDYSFAPAWRKRRAETGRLLASGETALDAQGRARARAVLDPGAALGPLTAVFEASVVSPERQRLFGRASTVVHRADLYYGIKAETNFVELGSSWTASAVAVRPDGRRAEALGAAWSLRRREWLSVERAGVAGRLEWVSEERETVVSSGSFAASPSTWTWSWTPDRPGAYEFSVSGRDEAGRPAETVAEFNAAGPGEAWWKRSDTDLIEIVADKNEYKPGETARLLVKSPYESARALITVEREGILSRWTQVLKGGASLVRVPLDDRSVPNVFVSVTLVRGRAGKAEYDDEGLDLAKPQAKFGYKMLAVNPGGRRLTVTVRADKAGYRPGAELTATVTVAGADGKPAPAEVTLFAVDEGVLNLTGYRTPDPFEDFYGPRPLLVGSADSRPFVIGQRSFGEKGRSRGGGGGRGSPLPGADLRANFSPTAFWGPTLKAGPDGKATASFKLPDSLTRFRLMAVAAEGRRFGSGEARVSVSKPLSLRPSLPRLARVGDEFEGGVVVHNFSNAGATVTVALALEGTAIAAEGAATRELFVPAGRAVETAWKCRATGLGPAEFRFAARSGGETDGLKWTVPVRATERLERSATSGATEGAVTETVARPADAEPGTGRLEASFSASALSGLREGARYLLEYPYGCLEQRLSRALPAIVGGDLVREFGLGTTDAIRAAAQKDLSRLPEFQHPSGGYGYWPDPWAPDPWLTAYALETAALARREGYALPEGSLAKAARWLKAYLASDKMDWAYPYGASEDYAARAYATYALGLNGDPQPASFRKLYERRDQLPYLAKAYLLKAAAAAAGETEAKALAGELLGGARVAPRTIHFEEPAGERSPWIHGSDARTTAAVLQAFLEARGGFPGDEKAVRWLVEERRNTGRWRTTVENAASLRALQDFYRRYEKETPAFSATLGREGEASAIWSERFDGRSLTARRRDFPLDEVLAGGRAVKLRLAKEGIGRLYYDLVLAYAPASFKKPAFEGFEITRKVVPLRGDLRAGKRAVVTLTVRSKQDRNFVALEDPLPAGWEIVDASFATEGREDARALADEAGRGQYWGSFQRAESYDDRIQVFADELTAGEHRWSFLIQATTPGRFHAPAAVVEQMYEPEVFGRTASDEAEVSR